jgi:hypothetical protein
MGARQLFAGETARQSCNLFGYTCDLFDWRKDREIGRILGPGLSATPP